MKIHDIILIIPNVINSKLCYVIFVKQESFGLYEDHLTKSSTLNNTDTHK